MWYLDYLRWQISWKWISVLTIPKVEKSQELHLHNSKKIEGNYVHFFLKCMCCGWIWTRKRNMKNCQKEKKKKDEIFGGPFSLNYKFTIDIMWTEFPFSQNLASTEWIWFSFYFMGKRWRMERVNTFQTLLTICWTRAWFS